MRPPELACRVRQETSKWLEQVARAAHTYTKTDAVLRTLAPVSELPAVHVLARGGDPDAASSLLLNRFRRTYLARFFAGAEGRETLSLLAVGPTDARDRTITAAEEVCQGRFNLLGYERLFFGDPIDWHLDPISGRRAPLVHWSRLDPALVGDAKVVWEINRHQWLLQLGQAYRFTGDERYAEAFARYVAEWMQANPKGMGINWASSLEVAFRLIAWCWALGLFDGSRTLSADLFTQMLAGIEAHAGHVERYLSSYFSPNTHLTGEALGLFYAGVLFPELPGARRWRALGARVLVEQCGRQILDDGVYFEQSTCYQRYTAEIYLHFLILAARNEIGVPDAVAQRIQRLLDFLVAVRRPDGSMPQIGDADSGWLLPLVPRESDDLRGVFAVAAAFFDRPDYAWAAGGLAPEVLWLLGPAGARTFETLAPAPPPTPPSRLFLDGGYVVMRSGWERDAHQLIFDVGPLGCPISGAHGHADLLSIQCAAFGEPYLVDSGTYCYASHPEWRDYFRSTAAHSTLRVDGCEQANPAGTFKWQARPRARLRRWLSAEAFDFADAEHDAYNGFSDPVTHRRRVAFVRAHYWVLVDDLEGSGEHLVELRFQFAPIEVHVDATLRAWARGRGGKGLLIIPFSNVPLKAGVHSGEVAPIQGWVSEEYGQRCLAPLLIYSTVTKLPLRIVTLLLPTLDPHGAGPSVKPLIGKEAMPVGLVFEDGGSVYFSDLGISQTVPGQERTEQ